MRYANWTVALVAGFFGALLANSIAPIHAAERDTGLTTTRLTITDDDGKTIGHWDENGIHLREDDELEKPHTVLQPGYVTISSGDRKPSVNLHAHAENGARTLLRGPNGDVAFELASSTNDGQDSLIRIWNATSERRATLGFDEEGKAGLTQDR